MIDYEHLPAAFAEWLSIDCYDVVVVSNQRMTSMTSHYVQCRAVHRDGECLGARLSSPCPRPRPGSHPHPQSL
jgi:hypothetical protein